MLHKYLFCYDDDDYQDDDDDDDTCGCDRVHLRPSRSTSVAAPSPGKPAIAA